MSLVIDSVASCAMLTSYPLEMETDEDSTPNLTPSSICVVKDIFADVVSLEVSVDLKPMLYVNLVVSEPDNTDTHSPIASSP